MIQPKRALVRPRVLASADADTELLEDAVADALAEGVRGIAIVGAPGSGRTTALAHVASVLAGEPDVRFLDEPSLWQVEEAESTSRIVYSREPRVGIASHRILE